MQTQHEADCRAWQHYCQMQGKGAENERKYTPQGGNFLAPSPSKTNDGAEVSRCIVRWKSQPEVTDDGRF